MNQDYPFVVAVASEKGGVGKTTIATNLAVYLKALREDLPVTIASFDNHFSVDQMFAIGGHRGASVAGLFAGNPAAELAQMGEYGVQFLASDRTLSPPDDDPGHLCRALTASRLSGILILDTRPILDYFTRNALIAADLVLVPVKDRASLVNAASLQQALRQAGEPLEKMWLLPSLVDARLRLRQEIGVREFLVFSAQERGYQVVDTFIAKSPKVEGLATSFTSRIHPVITHARGTVVHSQLRALAGFVLQRFDSAEGPRCQGLSPVSATSGRLGRRQVPDCPVCGNRAPGSAAGFAFQDLRSRRRGRLHPACLQTLLASTGLEVALPATGMLVCSSEGPGFTGPGADLSLHLFDGEAEPVAIEQMGDPAGTPFEPMLHGASGRSLNEFAREFLLVLLEAGPPDEAARFATLRRRVLREVLGRSKC
ncbi:MAG TPA: ParA family protein [Desulfuromonadales bacterium]|nr:ParA family protein [Desulfuromonadales bacterium]